MYFFVFENKFQIIPLILEVVIHRIAYFWFSESRFYDIIHKFILIFHVSIIKKKEEII